MATHITNNHKKNAQERQRRATKFEESERGRVRSLREVYAEELAAGKVPVRIDERTIVWRKPA